MTDEGYITAAQAKDGARHAADAANYQRNRSGNYIADWVMDVLPYHLGAIEQDVVVETTVDLDLQDAAEHAVADTLDEEGEKYGVGEGAMVVVDGTGAVRALVGGRSYAESQFNRAVEARRQPGSAFKPFVYLTAIEKLGYRPDTVMIDEPVTFGNWSPQNYDGKFRGPVTLVDALSHSINTVAAQLADQVTPEAVAQTAKRLGINSPLEAVPSIALGTSEVSLLELTGAYAPFSNGGYAVLPLRRAAHPHAARATSSSTAPGSSPRRVISIESVAHDELHAAGDGGDGDRHARGARRLAGRRQDRHEPEFPRRLVHRLHREPDRRRLGRQRYRRADQARLRRQCPGRDLVEIHDQGAPGRAGPAASGDRPRRLPPGAAARPAPSSKTEAAGASAPLAPTSGRRTSSARATGSSTSTIAPPLQPSRRDQAARLLPAALRGLGASASAPDGGEPEAGPVQPGARHLVVGVEASDHSPEPRPVVHHPKMRDLVRGEIVEHPRRRQHQPPGEGQHAL